MFRWSTYLNETFLQFRNDNVEQFGSVVAAIEIVAKIFQRQDLFRHRMIVTVCYSVRGSKFARVKGNCYAIRIE